MRQIARDALLLGLKLLVCSLFSLGISPKGQAAGKKCCQQEQQSDSYQQSPVRMHKTLLRQLERHRGTHNHIAVALREIDIFYT